VKNQKVIVVCTIEAIIYTAQGTHPNFFGRRHPARARNLFFFMRTTASTRRFVVPPIQNPFARSSPSQQNPPSSLSCQYWLTKCMKVSIPGKGCAVLKVLVVEAVTGRPVMAAM
jgi:hypothetical protein